MNFWRYLILSMACLKLTLAAGGMPAKMNSCLVALGPNQVGALKLLGKLDQVCAYGQKRWAYAAEIQNPRIQDLGYPPSLERLLRLKPSLVLANGGPWAVWEGVPWMERLGLPLLNYVDFLEPHPEDRLKWAVILGKKLGEASAAQRLANDFRQAYGRLKQRMQNIASEQRPLVLVGSLQGDTWVAPAGGQWMARLIEDAGGRYIWAAWPHEVRLPWEQVLRLAKQVDFWIPLNHWQHAAEIAASDVRYAFLKLAAGRIINNNQRLNDFMANDFWESGLYHPHELLAELQQLLHPPRVTRADYKWWRPL